MAEPQREIGPTNANVHNQNASVYCIACGRHAPCDCRRIQQLRRMVEPSWVERSSTIVEGIAIIVLLVLIYIWGSR